MVMAPSTKETAKSESKDSGRMAYTNNEHLPKQFKVIIIISLVFLFFTHTFRRRVLLFHQLVFVLKIYAFLADWKF